MERKEAVKVSNTVLQILIHVLITPKIINKKIKHANTIPGLQLVDSWVVSFL